MVKIILIFFTGTFSFAVSAQSLSPEVLSSSGEVYQGTSFFLDWTLGEVAIENLKDNESFQLSQGFHQANFRITTVVDLSEEIGEILVYPNPASDKIELDLRFPEKRNVNIQLTDVYGTIIFRRTEYGSSIKSVDDISNLPSGNYFLYFAIDKNEYFKTVQITKIN